MYYSKKHLIVPALLALGLSAFAQGALAALDSGPPLTTSTDCNLNPDALTCIEGPNPADLPGESPRRTTTEFYGVAVCSARVDTDFATSVTDLQTLTPCPSGSLFGQAKLALIQGSYGAQGPQCNRLEDLLRIRYPVLRNGIYQPSSGDCVRDDQVLFSLAF